MNPRQQFFLAACATTLTLGGGLIGLAIQNTDLLTNDIPLLILAIPSIYLLSKNYNKVFSKPVLAAV